MKPRTNKRKVLKQAIGVFLSLMAVAAWAQNAPPSAGSLLETVKEPPQAPRKSPTVDLQQEIRPAFRAASNFKVAVRGFRFSGNTTFSEAQLLPLVKDFVGKDLDLAGLDEAASDVSNYYRSKGYFVARAYLPAQEIKDGVVEIAVVEGRIGKVSIKAAPGTRLHEQTARQIVSAAAAPGQPIVEKNVERGLLLLNDLPGVDVKSTLVPGATPGTSDLVVEETEGGLLGGSVDIDNYGNRYTGRIRTGASVYLNDPQGIGDQVALRAMTSGDGMDYVRGSYIAPIGDRGSKLGLALSAMRYKLNGDFTVLDAQGRANVTSIFGLHPFVRTRSYSLYGTLGYDNKSLHDQYIPSTTDRRIGVGNVGLSGDIRDGLGGGGVSNFGVAYAEGNVDITGDAAAKTTDAVTTQTQGNYGKLNYNLSRLQRVTDHAPYVHLSAERQQKPRLVGEIHARWLGCACLSGG